MPAKSKAQQRLMGAAYGCKKTGKGCKGKAKELADTVSKKSLKDFASTKTKNLPQKKGKRK